jgi:hypothetical protein
MKTALEECATVSLILAYVATWFFAIDTPSRMRPGTPVEVA